MSQPKAVLFDWDNTLVDSWPAIHDALNLTFSTMGYPLWTMAEIRQRVRYSTRDAFPALFGADWERARRIYLESFEATHLERLRVLPGVEEMLAGLAACDVYLGIVSNKTGRLLRREVAALGWQDKFARVVGAGDAAFDKPHPAVVAMALEGSGLISGPEIWFVGDTELDIECACNAGCRPVLLGPPLAAVDGTLHGFRRFEDCWALAASLRGDMTCNETG